MLIELTEKEIQSISSWQEILRLLKLKGMPILGELYLKPDTKNYRWEAWSVDFGRKFYYKAEKLTDEC